MVDSIRMTHDDYIKRIHSNRGSGRLHKGHSIIAATASIPSKYQTVVISNNEQKGFLSQSRRFNQELTVNDNPGPGAYKNDSKPVTNPSVSKKGTGGFASKDRRIGKLEMTCSPGSTSYDLPSMLNTRNDHNVSGSTSIFHKPIAHITDKSDKNPAPNLYNVSLTSVRKTNNVTADASFKSKTQRDVYDVKDASQKPSPWQYNIREDLTKDSVKVPVSSFKSKTERKMAPDPYPVPGPGAYRPYEEPEMPKRLVFPRKHYLCISAPAMALPKSPPQPGPGTYEVVDYEGPDKHYMSSSMFVSTTSRWMGQATSTDMPGPAHYRPQGTKKQSFIYNAGGRWL